jgi:hypothetical protein
MSSTAVRAVDGNSYDGLKKTFHQVLGQEPSQAQLENLLRLRDALQLRYDDPVLLQLIAMEHYKAFFEEIPRQMEKASASFLRDFQTKLRTELKESEKTIAEQRALAAVSLRETAKEVITSTCTKIGETVIHESKAAAQTGLELTLSGLKSLAYRTQSELQEASSLFRHQLLWFALLVLLAIVVGTVFAGYGAEWYWSGPTRALDHLSAQDRKWHDLGRDLDTHWDKIDPKTKAFLKQFGWTTKEPGAPQ